jgi:Flp pilus assembly protein TadG
MGRGRKLVQWAAGFLRDRAGALAVNFALLVVPLSVIICGAIDMSSVFSDRQRMQQVADSTALDAAAQLVLADTSGVPQRANALALAELTKISDRVTLTPSTALSADGASVTVTIDGHRPSFFGSMLPPGGWKLRVRATAMSMGRTPLCVLHSGTKDGMTMDGGSLLTAPGCLIHSDGDIRVSQSAVLKADVVQAVGSATGQIQPAPLTGAAGIRDPFASMSIDIPKRAIYCTPIDQVRDGTDQSVYTLAAGVHCGNLTVAKNAVLKLAAGRHYFAKGNLTVEEGATLTDLDRTNGATLIFDTGSHLSFQDRATIDLSASTQGAYAGFVILTTRANRGAFSISSDNARRLLGTIYIPSATLAISGTANKVADQSAWTVIVADSIQMKGSPNLVINSNYAGASVPVPAGVGRNRGVVLTR